jgi:transposase InsO family protein
MTRLQGQGSVEWLCASAGVSRASYYRRWVEASPGREETALRDLVQRLALAERFYGYRRITERVRRQGFAVNRKRIARIMREDNLLALRKKPAFRPATTDSRHAFTVWPNLARRLILTASDQLWVADITYVRLDEAFVYLAVVLDGFSRKVVGWAMADHLRAELALEALDMALTSRQPAPGLIHHSDRGVQYASGDYIGRLLAYDLQPSMSRPGCPWDNAMAESFMKTLKTEEVDGCDYRNLADARARIGQFIDEVYNRQRLHSALRYLSPEEFEAQSTKLIHNPVDRIPRPTETTTTVSN